MALLQQTNYVYLEKVQKQGTRAVLNYYISSYSVLLDMVSKPIFYASRLKAIDLEIDNAHENLKYTNGMLNLLTRPHDLRRGSGAEQMKVNTASCGPNSFTCPAAKLWNISPSHVK